MNELDYAILILTGIGALLGLYKGFIKQLAALTGLIIGLLLAKALYVPLAEKMNTFLGQSLTVAQIIAFILIWLAVPLAFTLIGALLSKLMEAVSLGFINRLLGMGLGILKYVLIVSLAINLLEFFDSSNVLINESRKQESALYYPLKNLVGTIFPTISRMAQQYI